MPLSLVLPAAVTEMRRLMQQCPATPPGRQASPQRYTASQSPPRQTDSDSDAVCSCH